MAVLPPPDTPVLDPRTGKMNTIWYRYFWETQLINQPEERASYIEFSEITAPTNGGAKTGRLFCRDNGAGKAQLCIIFPTGAVEVIVTEV